MAVVTNVEWKDFDEDGLRAFVGNLTFYIASAGYSIDGKTAYEYGIEISVGDSDVDLRLGETSTMSVQEIKDDIELFWICNGILVANMVDHRNQDDF